MNLFTLTVDVEDFGVRGTTYTVLMEDEDGPNTKEYSFNPFEQDAGYLVTVECINLVSRAME